MATEGGRRPEGGALRCSGGCRRRHTAMALEPEHSVGDNVPMAT